MLQISFLPLLVFFCLIVSAEQLNAQDSSGTDSTAVQRSDSLAFEKNELYKKFREAFKKVIENKADSAQQKDLSKDPQLVLNGFVLNETITRMGNNFYNLFYQYWRAPEGVHFYYSIVIAEQPAPGFGSILLIKINNETVLKSRLQPKYSYLEALSKKAVMRVLSILQQKATVRKRLAGF